MQEHKKSIALSDLLKIVKESVEMIFSDSLWVTAEVLSISGTGHKYLDLVEYSSGRQELAKSRAMIWKDDTVMLKEFEKASGISLASGMKILFLAKPSFHPVYGLSLTIQAIDPTYTLGDMEARLKKIRDDLRQRGWWDLNRSLPAPLDFCRVAVIAPQNAAGLGDFRVYADKLNELGLCEFIYYPAQFQGKEATAQIVDQMVKVFEDNKTQPFDALVIIRGGGDKAGLYQLNDHRLTAYVCRFPIPVMVGIGHERDSVLLDEVAQGRYATPSMLIAHIAQHIVDKARKAQRDWDQIQSLAKAALLKAEAECDNYIGIVRSESVRRIDQAEKDLDHHVQGMIHSLEKANMSLDVMRESIAQRARDQILIAEDKADQLMSELMLHNPLTMLSKGYAVVKSNSGYITSTKKVNSGDIVNITLKDGSFTSTVIEVEN